MTRIKTYEELFETSPSAYFMEEPGWEAHKKAQPFSSQVSPEEMLMKLQTLLTPFFITHGKEATQNMLQTLMQNLEETR